MNFSDILPPEVIFAQKIEKEQKRWQMPELRKFYLS
jgi:hypothetical protein